MRSHDYFALSAAALAACCSLGCVDHACRDQVLAQPHPLSDFRALAFEVRLSNWEPTGRPKAREDHLWISGGLMGGASDPAARPFQCTVLNDDASVTLDGRALDLSRGGANWGPSACDCAGPDAKGDFALGDPKDGTFRIQDRSESLELTVRNLYARRTVSPARLDGLRGGQRLVFQYSVDTDQIESANASLSAPASGASPTGYYSPFASDGVKVTGSQLELTLPNDLPTGNLSLEMDLGINPAKTVSGSAQANAIGSVGIDWHLTVPLTVQ